MGKNDAKIVYVCNVCGAVYPKWAGKCKECGAWSSLEEEVQFAQKTKAATPSLSNNIPRSFSEDTYDSDEIRLTSGISEFDCALGGGIVKGSVILLSGEPGIGKSTILLQICKAITENKKVMYVSGEESYSQIKMRGKRLGVFDSENLYLLCETDLDSILARVDELSPDLLIIDSVQTTNTTMLDSISGSISQVKQCALSIIQKSKSSGISTILVGHVNKDGAIAGPKVLEHMVDVVLTFEGDRSQAYRIIRAAKNRYGSTNEIGVFEMSDKGLIEVRDPSRALLSERPERVSGSCAVCIHEGTRPMLAEVQSLVCKTVFPSPKRVVTGLDYNRVSILLAVIEKRLGIYLSSQDVYLNVIGGLKLEDPSVDLAVVMSIISAYRNIEIDSKTVAVGEVGLLGEVRSVSFASSRIKEASRLGYNRIILPYNCLPKELPPVPSDFEIIPVKSITDILTLFA